jgi:hypothetical protein
VDVTSSRNAEPADANGRAVLSFAADLANLSRTAALVDEIAEMHESGRWQRYRTAVGVEEWKPCEFDYFLIACDVDYDEISRVLAWNERGKALAPAMMGDDAKRRRPIEVAAASWHSPTGETLLDRAQRKGWTTARGALRRPPIPQRTLTRLRHGVSMDEQARRQRELQIPAKRRRELAQLAGAMTNDLTDLEVRYVRDQLTAKLAKDGRGRRGLDPDQLRRDIDQIGDDIGVLATHWGVSRETARKRLALARK